MIAEKIQKELLALANPAKAKFLQRYFKTGKGEYAEGDIFLGITVPAQRKVALLHTTAATLDDVLTLLSEKEHESRFVALEILVAKYEKASDLSERKRIYDFYIKHRSFINNWDLVDTSAPYIVGAYVWETKKKDVLYKLARSRAVWDRRIAVVATLYLIKENQFSEALELAHLLINDTHDLIHKAVGWMLREVGKRDKKLLLTFLDRYATRMPRTTVRYSIEKFPDVLKRKYLQRAS